jgi:hypothetical protein
MQLIIMDKDGRGETEREASLVLICTILREDLLFQFSVIACLTTLQEEVNKVNLRNMENVRCQDWAEISH